MLTNSTRKLVSVVVLLLLVGAAPLILFAHETYKFKRKAREAVHEYLHSASCGNFNQDTEPYAEYFSGYDPSCDEHEIQIVRTGPGTGRTEPIRLNNQSGEAIEVRFELDQKGEYVGISKATIERVK